jgi:hypothetical protein
LIVLIFELAIGVSIDLKTGCAAAEKIAASLRLSPVTLFYRTDIGYRIERIFKTP